MKKSIIIIAALFVTMVASAQLQLIKSINAEVLPSCINEGTYAYGDFDFPTQYLFSSSEVENKYVINFYDANTFDFYKTVTLDATILGFPRAASRNFWSTDGKLMFLIDEYNGKSDVSLLCDEDGNIVQRFGGSLIFKNLNGYILYAYTDGKMEFYAIPGDIDPTTPITNVPSKKTRAKKSMNKGIVQINTEDHLFTVTGQTLK